jgi:hypothetical protein
MLDSCLDISHRAISAVLALVERPYAQQFSKQIPSPFISAGKPQKEKKILAQLFLVEEAATLRSLPLRRAISRLSLGTAGHF